MQMHKRNDILFRRLPRYCLRSFLIALVFLLLWFLLYLMAPLDV